MPIVTIPAFDMNRMPSVSDEANFHAHATYSWTYLASELVPSMNTSIAAINAALNGASTIVDSVATLSTQVAGKLDKAQNLADLPNKAAARENLGAHKAGNLTEGKVHIDRLPTGLAANKLVKLDSNAKLPAVDGSRLTDLPGGWEPFAPNNDVIYDHAVHGGVGEIVINLADGYDYRFICQNMGSNVQLRPLWSVKKEGDATWHHGAYISNANVNANNIFAFHMNIFDARRMSRSKIFDVWENMNSNSPDGTLVATSLHSGHGYASKMISSNAPFKIEAIKLHFNVSLTLTRGRLYGYRKAMK